MAQPIKNHYMLTNGGLPGRLLLMLYLVLIWYQIVIWPGLTLSGLVPEKPDGLVSCRL